MKRRTDPATVLLRQLLRDDRLASVEISVRERGCIACAIPSSLHPAVAERMHHAVAKAGGSINMVEAAEARARALGSVALGRGRTVLEALGALAAALEAAGA